MSGRKKSVSAEPWTPAKATKKIREKAQDTALDVGLTNHTKEQMAARGLIMSDVLHVLKYGYVYEPAEPAKEQGYHKYKIESPTPNSGNRAVRVVVIPYQTPSLTIVTVMWADEKSKQSA